jgi:hypothetical protein
VAGRRRKADADLILALACGATPENAAQKAGLGLRTVYRRLAEPGFRARVDAVRADIVRRLAGVLTTASIGAINTFTTLQASAVSESVRLGAARATLELGCKLRESVELTERLAAVEVRLEALLDCSAKPERNSADVPVQQTRIVGDPGAVTIQSGANPG